MAVLISSQSPDEFLEIKIGELERAQFGEAASAMTVKRLAAACSLAIAVACASFICTHFQARSRTSCGSADVTDSPRFVSGRS